MDWLHLSGGSTAENQLGQHDCDGGSCGRGFGLGLGSLSSFHLLRFVQINVKENIVRV